MTARAFMTAATVAVSLCGVKEDTKILKKGYNTVDLRNGLSPMPAYETKIMGCRRLARASRNTRGMGTHLEIPYSGVCIEDLLIPWGQQKRQKSSIKNLCHAIMTLLRAFLTSRSMQSWSAPG
ncbi:hypothetical protein FN846DRAFT_139994 [Sphaerosporella brunnea]|uniref:Uncharacterized protein n=1 Tax=Sphaerosporella brunnea TaxID=1250544 RepID=A0A5J5ERL6_9PEZI|nr:hypothetical protein FN846DRAFT_139994 [Sphaerosporella brunnea]